MIEWEKEGFACSTPAVLPPLHSNYPMLCMAADTPLMLRKTVSRSLLLGVIRTGPVAFQKLNLQEVEHVGTRISELDRFFEYRIAVEERLLQPARSPP